MAPTSLMKYKLLNQISMINIASTILMKGSGTGKNTFVKTTIFATIIKKSVMLQILVNASFPKVFVYMKKTPILIHPC